MQNRYSRKFFFLLWFIFALGVHSLQAQNAPEWMKYMVREQITDPDYAESLVILDPYTISTVRITMDESDYNKLMTDVESDVYLMADMTYESPTVSLRTIQQVGIRLRGAAARKVAKKKSFKISFRAFGYDDREFYSLRKLNLNCDFEDPHLMRAKVCTDFFRLMGVAAARVGYTKLYINNEYRGLFANYEELDKAFLKTRFGDNDGNLYKCDKASMEVGTKGYELVTNEEAADHSDILEFIDVLNNTTQENFKEEIEKVFDVDKMLMMTACNVLLGAWDDYWVLKKNYYLYHDLYTDQFKYIPHDFDGSLGTYWYPKDMDVAVQNVYDYSPNPGRPMIENLLAVPEYRNRYTHYLMLLCMYPFSLEAMEPEIDRTADMIRETLINDPYWGWTPSNFDIAFEEAISEGRVKYGMKEYIRLRRQSALEQLENIGPFIKEIERSPLLPKGDDPIKITQLVIDRVDVTNVKLVYKKNNTSDEIMMTNNEATDIYTALIPAQANDGIVRYYIEATNSSGEKSRYPAENEWNTIYINYQPPKIVINELLASNQTTKKDENNGYGDWFELYNQGDEAISLFGMYVSDDIKNPRKWRLGNISIPAKGFVLLWADGDPEQGSNHLGFKLNADGEELALFDTDDKQNLLIDVIAFDEQTTDISLGRSKDGGDSWRYFLTPTPGFGNEEIPPYDPTVNPGNLTDITDLGGEAVHEKGNTPLAGTPTDAIDNNIETNFWTIGDAVWIQYSLDQPSIVKGYTITSSTEKPENDPSAWTFEAYDETLEEWVVLHTVTYQPPWKDRMETKEFFFSNSDIYNTYRLNITDTHDSGMLQFAEWAIYGEVENIPDFSDLIDITEIEGAVISGQFDNEAWPGTGSPVNEKIDKLTDNFAHTKYLVGEDASWIEIETDSLLVVTAYTIRSANDQPNRDPRSWQLQAWDEENNKWITLHSVINQPVWQNRLQKKTWTFDNEMAYRKYRLLITSTNGASDGYMQISELEILGKTTVVISSVEKIHTDEITIYPNPVCEFLNIQSDCGLHKAVIFDISGKIIKQLNMNNSYNISVDVSNLKSGLYFTRFETTSGKIYTAKILKY